MNAIGSFSPGDASVILLVANNTPYTIYTSSQPQYGQYYAEHGEIVFVPENTQSPVGTSVSTAAYGASNVGIAAVGPAVSFLVQIQDSSGVLAGLDIACWVPIGISNNGVAVAFNQDIVSWLNNFSGSPGTIQVSTSQTLSDGNTVDVYVAMNAQTGDWPTACALLTVQNS